MWVSLFDGVGCHCNDVERDWAIFARCKYRCLIQIYLENDEIRACVNQLDIVGFGLITKLQQVF